MSSIGDTSLGQFAESPWATSTPPNTGAFGYESVPARERPAGKCRCAAAGLPASAAPGSIEVGHFIPPQPRRKGERKAVGMAKCEEGYLCEVCGRDVEAITDSDLYLRYVIGLVDPEVLHTQRERHVGCNPSLAQFIVDPRFEPVAVEGPFDKRLLDPAYVRERETLVTRGWQRLHELGGVERIIDYPLPEVRAKLERRVL